MKKINIQPELIKVLSKMKSRSHIAGLLCNGEIPEELLIDNHVDYIGLSTTNTKMISYLTDERIKAIEGDLWTSNKRYICKPGSLLKKIFKNVNDYDIEIFVTLYKAYSSVIDMNFEVVSGDRIKELYDERMYSELSGTLGSSCMKNSNYGHLLQIYTENPHIVSMLVAYDRIGKIIGRALLWNTPEYKVMDRVYTINNETWEIYFFDWGMENGYIRKDRQSYSHPLMFNDNKGKSFSAPIEIQMGKWDYPTSEYPYIDTFKWLDKNTGKLFNYMPEHFIDNKDCYHLSNVGGVSPGNSYCIDMVDGTLCCLHDSIFVDNTRTRIQNTVYSKTYKRYLLRRDAIFSEEYMDFIYSDNSKNDMDLIKIYYNHYMDGLELKRRYTAKFDIGDNITFEINGQRLPYRIERSYLSYDFGNNDEIFKLIGVEKESFCERSYGYKPSGGGWPEYHIDDVRAMNDVIFDIFVATGQVHKYLSKPIATTIKRMLWV